MNENKCMKLFFIAYRIKIKQPSIFWYLPTSLNTTPTTCIFLNTLPTGFEGLSHFTPLFL